MTEKIIPDGYKLVAVKGLDELVYWLERCKDKGHIENCADLIEPFEAFEYRNVSEESVISAHEAKAAPAAPQGEPVYQLARATGPVADAWIDVAKDVYDDAGFYPSDFKRRILSATTAAPSQEPVTDEYAGVIAWVGDKQCKRVLTEGAIKHEHTPGVAMRNTAHQCVQEVIIAALREKEAKATP